MVVAAKVLFCDVPEVIREVVLRAVAAMVHLSSYPLEKALLEGASWEALDLPVAQASLEVVLALDKMAASVGQLASVLVAAGAVVWLERLSMASTDSDPLKQRCQATDLDLCPRRQAKLPPLTNPCELVSWSLQA